MIFMKTNISFMSSLSQTKIDSDMEISVLSHLMCLDATTMYCPPLMTKAFMRVFRGWNRKRDVFVLFCFFFLCCCLGFSFVRLICEALDP